MEVLGRSREAHVSFGKRQPVGYRGFERRRAIRQHAHGSAHIVLPTGQIVQCRVKDFSNTGARLAVATTFGLPHAFELRSAGHTYQVKVARRGSGHIGVEFD